MFLELFGGKGHVAAAWRHQGFATIVFEIELGDQFDLCRSATIKLIEGWLSSHCVAGLWLGTPCTTWSRARRGPPDSAWCAIRSSKHILGFEGLRLRDLEKVRLGNLTAKVSARLIRRCIALHIPCGLENPLTSMFWIFPFLAQVDSASVGS